MHGVDGTSPRGPRRRLAIALAGAATAMIALAACTSGNSHSATGSQPAGHSGSATVAPSGSASSSSKAPAPAAAVTVSAVGGLAKANPAKPITVTAQHGKLTAVSVTNTAGKKVSGQLAADGTSWTSNEDLGYSRTYTVHSTATNADGHATTSVRKISTVTPDNMTMPYLNDIYGTTLTNGATYGIGMVAVVHFDEQIPNKAAAEKVMSVTTSPHVDGAWYWTDDSTAHWRPRSFYQPGTKVSLAVKAYGTDFGHGLYGQSDERTSFTIGAKHVSIASAKTHYVKVYNGDTLVRRMPTSMGQGGTVEGKNGPIYLWTPPGTYTVINHENPATMSSDSYGLPASSPYGYKAEKVYWSTKISTDGIYLHELDTTVWAQGHQNLSHGCLNLNYTNAKWFYNFSRVGDVVKVVQSGGPKLTIWQGGDWSVPWSTWAKGGAAA